ncbi:SDR family NAD(P)-dependent oxidoreductase, partial [Streptomyces sparsogenes]|uniref:SDR family NAD(P)-dependent oxidoreductase n=1 Tax=Streptomyces sparsogenes TaxID=67365 RepID=UPI0033C6C996
AYAAANAYLDALVERRRAEGLTGLSIAWGPWAGVGMVASDTASSFFRDRGLGAMAPDAALRVLGDALAQGDSVLTVADIDWVRFAQTFTAQRPSQLLVDIPQVAEALEEGARAGADSPLRRQVEAAAPAQRRQVLSQHVRALAASVLGHAGPDAITATRPFNEMGFDSLTAVELRNKLSSSIGLPLPTTLIFDYPTADDLAGYLLSEISGVEPGTAPTHLHALPADAGDPIAIVGMACRFPGGVSNADQLWEMVVAGTDTVGPFPTDRGWHLDTIYDSDPDRPGTSYVREGGFLYDATRFDAGFFGISPREALAMDPQQRLLLETAWETFENAGMDVGTLRGSNTGVYAGATIFDYLSIVNHSSADVEGYIGTGNMGCIVSGRLSYAMGFEGPAVTVDTGCSSSLVALHMAVQALRAGECSLALTGGVTVMATPGGFVEFSRQRGIAKDGRCKPFAAAADGTGWSEGVGVLLLERLSDARRNGHRVLAVVRGSAVNQDGASNGLTAPNGPSQQRVIRQALANAGLSAAEVDAVEAHGTGTTLGDPIEAQALLATYGQGRPEERPLWLGSIKSNIGHTQAAAGVAGVIKMVQSLRHGMLPASLHIDAPTPHVDWSSGAIELLTEATPFPEAGRPRRAGVSAFGISGTNAHVIVEEAPEEEESREAVELLPLGGVVPWVVSGQSPDALRAQAARLAEFARASDAEGEAVGWSLVASRSVLDHRAVVVGRDRDELLTALDALAGGAPSGAVVTGTGAAASGGAGPVLVFPGQGAQWRGMGVGLLGSSPVFAARIAECEAALAPFVDWSLREVLRGEGETDLARVDVVQPVLWAVMVSLASVWESYGVRPAAVVGHSQGEIAAAVVAGALSLLDGARIVAVRSQALRVLSGGGAMASLAVGQAEAEEFIGGRAGVGVAAVNGPFSTVVSGPPEAVAEVVAGVAATGRRARVIDVDYASHGPQVDEIADDLMALLGEVTPTETGVAFYSSLTGGRIETSTLTAAYWVDNLRHQVRFSTAVEAVLADGYRVLIESSPHPVLAVGVQETAEALDVPVAVVPTLQRDQGGPAQLARALGQAFTAGLPVDWKAWFGVTDPAAPAPPLLDLPTYAFQRQRHWLIADRTGEPTELGLTNPDHPLLAAAMQLADENTLVLTGRLSRETHTWPWLAEHRVGDSVLMPGAAFADLALHAAARAGCDHVSELTLHAPLVIPDEGAIHLQVTVGPPSENDESGERSITFHSRPATGLDGDEDEAAWTRHASGTLATRPDDAAPAPEPLDGVWPPADATPIRPPVPEPGIAGLWRLGEELYAEVALDDAERADATAYGLHPALFNAALRAVALGAERGAEGQGGDDEEEIVLPFSWSGLRLHAVGATDLRVRVRVSADKELSLATADPQGAPVATLQALAMRPVRLAELQPAGGGAERRSMFHLVWAPLPAPALAPPLPDLRMAVVGADADEPLLGVLPDTTLTCPDLPALREAIADSGTAPELILAAVPGSQDAAERTREVTGSHLAAFQTWLADPVLSTSQLALVTRGAVATHPGEDVPDLAAAALWGLARSLQSEQPGQLVLLDLDDSDASLRALPAALAAAFTSDQRELALRAGSIHAPQLTRHPAGDPEPTAADPELPAFDPDGTVLITGGTGALGAVIARHMVTRYGARHVLLASRRGADAPGAAELAADLTDLGAQVTLTACDIGDRAALTALLAAVPGEHPLTAVVHTAGIVKDGIVQSIAPDELREVLRVKAEAAWHLHDLTRGLPLSMFVLYSSLAGVIGGAGQGSYAAGNTFLDALAHHRRAQGLPGTSLAWGYWEQDTGMAGLKAVVARNARIGVNGLTPEEALALFDAAVAGGEPFLVPARLDLARIRRHPRRSEVPLALRHLLPNAAAQGAAGGVRSAASPGSFGQTLLTLPEADRRQAVLDMVCGHAAAVLGHDSAAALQPDQKFRELGFDSLTAVELRNRINADTGLRLPATLVFDHPSPAAIAAHLHERLAPDGEAAAASLLAELDRIEAALAGVLNGGDGEERQHHLAIAGRLQELAHKAGAASALSVAPDHDDLGTATDDELFSVLDELSGLHGGGARNHADNGDTSRRD